MCRLPHHIRFVPPRMHEVYFFLFQKKILIGYITLFWTISIKCNVHRYIYPFCYTTVSWRKSQVTRYPLSIFFAPDKSSHSGGTRVQSNDYCCSFPTTKTIQRRQRWVQLTQAPLKIDPSHHTASHCLNKDLI